MLPKSKVGKLLRREVREEEGRRGEKQKPIRVRLRSRRPIEGFRDTGGETCTLGQERAGWVLS